MIKQSDAVQFCITVPETSKPTPEDTWKAVAVSMSDIARGPNVAAFLDRRLNVSSRIRLDRAARSFWRLR